MQNADLKLGDRHVTKHENFEIQDGGRPPFLKSLKI